MLFKKIYLSPEIGQLAACEFLFDIGTLSFNGFVKCLNVFTYEKILPLMVIEI